MTDHPSAAAAAPLQHRIGEGFDLLRQGRVADAVRHADALRAEHPANAEVQFLASEARLAADDPEGALECLDAAVALRPDEPVLLIKQAEACVGLRRRAAARAAATRAAALAPANGATQRAVGRIFTGLDDPATARRYYESALAAGHAEPAMLYELASAQHFTGDTDAADATLAALLARAPTAGAVLHMRSTLRRATPERNHVADLEARLAAPFPSDLDRAGALYALARELEELGEGERAFAAIGEAAALRHGMLRGYDVAAEIAAIDAVCAAYDAAELARAVPGHDEDGPIFIVGMPRSGTTLVERLLSRHPRVGSAGELLDFGQALGAALRRLPPVEGETPVAASLRADFAALGRDYLRGAREAAPARPLFVDKMPSNYMYCGLIRRALPRARIVHVTRDPMDAGFAMFKTLFGQAYLFSYDQRGIADMLACHERTMRHWKSVLGDAIVTVRYEDLVADTEGQARRLLEALGLAWDPAVLADAGNDRLSTTASAAQVREPIHDRSVGRWRDHEAGLAPLKARLVELGVLAG